MRWILLLLVPSVVSAAGLTGIWSAVFEDDQPGVNRVVIVDADQRLFFHYESDYGHRCEVFGIAKRVGRGLFVFKNVSEYRFYEGYEGYGFEENQDCEVSFEDKTTTLKVSSKGNCRSFCGMNGGIGGELRKIPPETLEIRSKDIE